MGLITFALRRPYTVMVGIAAVVIGCVLALRSMPVDIFPKLNLPVIYVCQPYGGMDPAQMEGLVTNYYEFHFLYINGIQRVESKSIHGVALMKLVFHPGTNMPQAMAETVTQVNRSRAFMPTGTVPPFVMRFDTGSVPVGYLVLSSETRELKEIQDAALFKVRPLFASLPGVSTPPPFGGNQRTIVVRIDPGRLRAYGLSPEEVASSLASGNTITPSGNIRLGDDFPIVPSNALAPDIEEMERIPIRTSGSQPAIFLRDVGHIEDGADVPTSYALINGRRAIYMNVTKRADASTLAVVQSVNDALPRIQDVLPDDIRVSLEFDQTPFVTRAIDGLLMEGALGAFLTGLMVLIFLRDVRSVIVVVLNIPLALMGATVALWIADQTINLMTLGGLALAVGVLVDEATVELENIHARIAETGSVPRAIRLGNAQTATPRLLAMLCILAVFLPSFFMEGAARALFVPLSLAVGFAMIASYILSSTFVPVVSAWLLKAPRPSTAHARPNVGGVRSWFELTVGQIVHHRIAVTVFYLAGSAAAIVYLGTSLGVEIFPNVDTGQFRLRLRAPNGTHVERTEKITLDVLDAIVKEVGADNVEMTLGYVGSIPSTYPVQVVYQWSRGPEEAILRVALKRRSGVRVEPLKERLREVLRERFPDVRFSFEPADVVNEVMTFGSPTPIEVAVNGPDLALSRQYLSRVQDQIARIPAIRDLQIAQSLDYPAVRVAINREKAGVSGVTASDVSRSLVAATSSSRFVTPIYWPDPKTGIGYQVQIEVPQSSMTSVESLKAVPVNKQGMAPVLLGDVADVYRGVVSGEYDRFNMRREVSLTANIAGDDLGSMSRKISDAIAAAGEPPRGARVEVRGQIPPLRQIMSGLASGLLLSILAIFLLLSANFQSPRLALVTASTIPAALVGVLLALWLTGTTVNIQSFIGAIMAAGVAMANAILLVSFAEQRRRRGDSAIVAAIEAASTRLRPIIMTSAAMIAGMIPLALALGEGGEQTAPLGRAVIGGLAAATVATLFVLPAIFAEAQSRAPAHSASLDPDDRASPNYDAYEPPADPVDSFQSGRWSGLWLERIPNRRPNETSSPREPDHVI